MLVDGHVFEQPLSLGLCVVAATQAAGDRWLRAEDTTSGLDCLLDVVKRDMFGLRSADDKIFDSVVGFDAVDVMDHFAARQLSSEMFFHEEAMNQQYLASSVDDDVSEAVDGANATTPRRAPFALERSVIRRHAGAGATERRLMLELVGTHGELAVTGNTLDDWHVASLSQLLTLENG